MLHGFALHLTLAVLVGEGLLPRGPGPHAAAAADVGAVGLVGRLRGLRQRRLRGQLPSHGRRRRQQASHGVE